MDRINYFALTYCSSLACANSEIIGSDCFSLFFLLGSIRKPELFSNREAIILGLKETLRYGLFLGTFAGTFVSVDEIIAALGGHRRQSLIFSVLHLSV